MAITTLQGVKDGLKQPILAFKSSVSPGSAGAGRLVTPFYAGGVPEAAAAPSPGLNGAALTSYAGQIPWQNPASGNAHLAGLSGSCGALHAVFGSSGFVMLADRLWHNSSIAVTTTTQQSITSPTWPARDRNGATAGDGVYVGIEVSSALGNGSPITNTTLSYTNSAGTSGRTGIIASFPATGPQGLFIPFELQAGDVGIRSVEGLTLGTSYVSGTMHLVAFRPLTAWATGSEDVNSDTLLDAIGIGLPRMYNNSVPFPLFVNSNSTNQTAGGGGAIQVTHG